MIKFSKIFLAKQVSVGTIYSDFFRKGYLCDLKMRLLLLQVLRVA